MTKCHLLPTITPTYLMTHQSAITNASDFVCHYKNYNHTFKDEETTFINVDIIDKTLHNTIKCIKCTYTKSIAPKVKRLKD